MTLSTTVGGVGWGSHFCPKWRNLVLYKLAGFAKRVSHRREGDFDVMQEEIEGPRGVSLRIARKPLQKSPPLCPPDLGAG